MGPTMPCKDTWLKSKVMIYIIRIGHKQSWGFEPRVLRGSKHSEGLK